MNTPKPLLCLLCALSATGIAAGAEREAASVHKRDRQGRTPLILTAAWSHTHISLGLDETEAKEAERLIQAGADINAQDHSGKTALMWAAGWHHPEILDVLLKHGADVHIRDRKGRTALSWAARWKNDEIIPKLLERGAKVGLVEALLLEDDARVKQLLAAGTEVGGRGGYGETPLMIAAERADQDLAITLLDRGARIDARDDYGRTVLMWAVGRPPQFSSHGLPIAVADPAAGKRPALIRELIRRGADPDALGAQPDSILDRKGLSALMRAVDYGTLDTIKALVEAGADVNLRSREWKQTALSVAIQKDQNESVTYLLSQGADPKIADSFGSTPLHMAAGGENLPLAAMLLDRGADIDARDREGTTPLVQSNAKTVRFLIERGADVRIRNRRGESALMWAAMRKDSRLIEFLRAETRELNLLEALYLRDEPAAIALIRRGKGLRSRTSYRDTPLIIAARLGLHDTARALLRQSVKVDERNLLDQTALLVACEAGNESLVRLLLDHGADPSAKSDLGDSPLSLAEEIGSAALIGMLKEAIARRGKSAK